MVDRLFSGYCNLWRKTPGAMTLAHYWFVTFVVVFVLMGINLLWGLGALLFWWVSVVGMVPICVAWDCGLIW